MGDMDIEHALNAVFGNLGGFQMHSEVWCGIQAAKVVELPPKQVRLGI